jgi:hypothetical protein
LHKYVFLLTKFRDNRKKHLVFNGSRHDSPEENLLGIAQSLIEIIKAGLLLLLLVAGGQFNHTDVTILTLNLPAKNGVPSGSGKGYVFLGMHPGSVP